MGHDFTDWRDFFFWWLASLFAAATVVAAKLGLRLYGLAGDPRPIRPSRNTGTAAAAMLRWARSPRCPPLRPSRSCWSATTTSIRSPPC
jgi:hypothetical protein